MHKSAAKAAQTSKPKPKPPPPQPPRPLALPAGPMSPNVEM